jgi:hypothetical protein
MPLKHVSVAKSLKKTCRGRVLKQGRGFYKEEGFCAKREEVVQEGRRLYKKEGGCKRRLQKEEGGCRRNMEVV